MGLQSSSMAAIQMTSLVSMTCWACLSLPLVMGPSSASWCFMVLALSCVIITVLGLFMYASGHGPFKCFMVLALSCVLITKFGANIYYNR